MDHNKFKVSFSGGGFRASFYCLGGYRRLVELGIHKHVSDISSVSGGSITAGLIMAALSEGDFENIDDFDRRVTLLLRKAGQINLRKKIIKEALRLTRNNFKLELIRTRFSRLFPEILDAELYRGKLISELKSYPEWSCNATCLNTMKRFRFKQRDIYGNNVGYSSEVNNLSLAFAVAASAAFPIMFAPIRFDVSNKTFIEKYPSANTLRNPKVLFLTDGGVYDNLGSENLLKDINIPCIFMDASAEKTIWPSNYTPKYHSYLWRILDVSMDQIINLRRRLIYHASNRNNIQLLLDKPFLDIVDSELKYRNHPRKLTDYSMVNINFDKLISGLRTDLDAFHDIEIDYLMWAGAIRMDLAIKSLLPNVVPNLKWDDIPPRPNYNDNRVKEVLTIGNKRKNFGILHQNLHL